MMVQRCMVCMKNSCIICVKGKTSNYSFCVQGFRLIKCSFHKLADKFAVHVHTRLSVKFMHEPFSTLIN